MYRTILAPLDGSKRAEAILPHVEALAKLVSAKVIFLQVIEMSYVRLDQQGGSPEMETERIAMRKQEVESYLTALQGEFRQRGIQAKGLMEFGPVVETILNVAERENADLVAMASHGRTGLQRVFYGSVAAGILNRIDRPLLLIRAQ